MSVVMFSYAITVISLSAGLLVTFLGIPVLAAGLAGSRALGSVERARARALLDLDVADPAPLRAAKPGLMGWVGAVLKSGVSWRHLLYSLLHFPWALFAFVFSVTFWTVRLEPADLPAVAVDRSPTYLGQPGLQMWGDGHGNGVYCRLPVGDRRSPAAIGLLIVLAGPWVIRGLTQRGPGPGRTVCSARRPAGQPGDGAGVGPGRGGRHRRGRPAAHRTRPARRRAGPARRARHGSGPGQGEADWRTPRPPRRWSTRRTAR